MKINKIAGIELASILALASLNILATPLLGALYAVSNSSNSASLIASVNEQQKLSLKQNTKFEIVALNTRFGMTK